ncbi:MAG: membrane protein insertion efficiency factor YidD [Lentisphaeria bacterium]|nr:membrane protein insertion efficiency factor YidD [Lentisphaeria bacterium]
MPSDTDTPAADQPRQAAGGHAGNGGAAAPGRCVAGERCGFPARVLIFLIRIYQKTVAPWLPPDCCRFYPSCSHYAVEALQVHGVFRGIGLTVWRLLRCQPFCRGGYDPVPPRSGCKPSPRPDVSSEPDRDQDIA